MLAGLFPSVLHTFPESHTQVGIFSEKNMIEISENREMQVLLTNVGCIPVPDSTKVILKQYPMRWIG